MGASKNSGMRTQAIRARQLPTQNPLQNIPRIPAKAANSNDRPRADIQLTSQLALAHFDSEDVTQQLTLGIPVAAAAGAREARTGQSRSILRLLPTQQLFDATDDTTSGLFAEADANIIAEPDTGHWRLKR
jgi:hypothetical protein